MADQTTSRIVRSAPAMPAVSVARPERPSPLLLQLQRSAGNSAVSSLLMGLQTPPRDKAPGDTVLARAPAPTGSPTKGRLPVLGQDYFDWSPGREASNVKASLRRETKLVATRWWEVGPGRLRVEYTQRANLDTSDRRWARLDVDVTVYLDPREALPKSLGAAASVEGYRVKGDWGSRGDGEDYEPLEEGATLSGGSARSLLGLSAGLPEYARLQPVEAQEAALLRHLSRLRKRSAGPPVVGPDAPNSGSRRPQGNGPVAEAVMEAADVITDLLPGISNLKDFYTFYTGKTVTGEKVGWLERLAALFFAIPGVGTLGKFAKKGAAYVGKHIVAPLVRKLKKRFPRLASWLEKKVVKMRSVKDIDEERQAVLKEIDDKIGDDRLIAGDIVEENSLQGLRPRDTDELLDGLEEVVRRGGDHAGEAAKTLKEVEVLNQQRKELREERKRAKRHEREAERRGRVRARARGEDG